MIDVNSMTAEEKEALRAMLDKDNIEREEQQRLARYNYKGMTEELVRKTFPKLLELSEFIAAAKKEIFGEFETIIKLKQELYDVKEEQKSHTFTTKDGLTITIGYRTIDTFDDTVHAGIEKIKNWIYSLADGDKRAEIESVIDILLKKDKNGNLKASRVLELKNMAAKINDKEFDDGVKIIEEAFTPAKSSTFITAAYKNSLGQLINVPLSITSVE